MRTLGRMWRGLWPVFRRYRESRDEAESGELESGGMWIRPALRLAIVFALLFVKVFFAFLWAGSAVRVSPERGADRAAPALGFWVTVRAAVPPQPIPWAVVEDVPAGQPPFF